MVWKMNLSFVSLLFLSVFISTHSAPSSPWNQAGLNLIFKPDLNRQTQLQQITKNKNNETTTTIHHHILSGSGNNNNINSQNYQYTPHSQDIGNPNSNDLVQQNHNNHLSQSKSNGGGGKTRKIAKTRTGSHSWGYTRYGQDIGHIRHMTNRKHLLPSNRNVPCPRDYIQTYNGKCRRIPKFSPSRVG